MDDALIIELFMARDGRALDEVSSKYGAVCRSIAKNVLRNPEDAEECVNDVLLMLWDSIPPEVPFSLKAYALVLTRRRALKALRDNSVKKKGGGITSESLDELSECLPAPDNVERIVEANELSRHINEWLAALPEEDRMLFLRRYWYEDTVGELAEERGESLKKTSRRLALLRKKLKKHLEREECL